MIYQRGCYFEAKTGKTDTSECLKHENSDYTFKCYNLTGL